MSNRRPMPKRMGDDRESELEFLIESLEEQQASIVKRMTDIEARRLEFKVELDKIRTEAVEAIEIKAKSGASCQVRPDYLKKQSRNAR